MCLKAHDSECVGHWFVVTKDDVQMVVQEDFPVLLFPAKPIAVIIENLASLQFVRSYNGEIVDQQVYMIVFMNTTSQQVALIGRQSHFRFTFAQCRAFVVFVHKNLIGRVYNSIAAQDFTEIFAFVVEGTRRFAERQAIILEWNDGLNTGQFNRLKIWEYSFSQLIVNKP